MATTATATAMTTPGKTDASAHSPHTPSPSSRSIRRKSGSVTSPGIHSTHSADGKGVRAKQRSRTPDVFKRLMGKSRGSSRDKDNKDSNGDTNSSNGYNGNIGGSSHHDTPKRGGRKNRANSTSEAPFSPGGSEAASLSASLSSFSTSKPKSGSLHAHRTSRSSMLSRNSHGNHNNNNNNNSHHSNHSSNSNETNKKTKRGQNGGKTQPRKPRSRSWGAMKDRMTLGRKDNRSNHTTASNRKDDGDAVGDENNVNHSSGRRHSTSHDSSSSKHRHTSDEHDDGAGHGSRNNHHQSSDEHEQQDHEKQDHEQNEQDHDHEQDDDDVELAKHNKQRRSRSRLRKGDKPKSVAKRKPKRNSKNQKHSRKPASQSLVSELECLDDDESHEGSVHEEGLNDDNNNNNNNQSSAHNNSKSGLSDSNHSRSSKSSMLSPKRIVGSSKRLINRLRSRSRGRSMNRGSGHGSSSGASKSPHSSKNSFGAITITPQLYRRARKCRWDDVLDLCADDSKGEASVGAKFVSSKDGTTALHMAVMSRTGYIQEFKSTDNELDAAPLAILDALLQLNPDAAKQTCTLNGYTPLVYACLVCSDKYQVDEAAKMIELFHQYCPEAFAVFTTEGLSPIDIHIVSYSHHHKNKEEADGLGRTSTAVLRLLLMHGAEHANLRLRQKVVKNKNDDHDDADGDHDNDNADDDANDNDHDQKQSAQRGTINDKSLIKTKTVVEGPIEYLYKCNADAFSKTVIDEIYDSDDEGSVWSALSTPSKRQDVIKQVSKWWVWKWAVMILKYGSLKQKRKGAKFAAVHTAAWQVGCPVQLLTIALYAFPKQVQQTLESKDGVENLPLHLVCGWTFPNDEVGTSSNKAESVVAYRKSQAIARLLEEYQDGAKKRNNRGETPLELALRTGTTWDLGVRRLVRAFPKAIKIQSKTSSLYPFMTAAAAAEPNDAPQDVQSIRTIYGLLRSSPKVLISCFA